jgi:TonB-dependent receptor
MAATGGGNRETNISGISQYALQGVEVFKSLTADMEANSVAGTINLKLRETPAGLHYNLMAQGGYNDLNNYFGNYKGSAEIGNRFFKNKLGMFVSLNAEKVMRSVQTMSAGYGLQGTAVDILLNGISLNNISTIKYRRSAMLSMDYRVSPTTTLFLYGLYTYSNDDHSRQTKNYGTTGIGAVSYNFHDNPYRNTDIVQSALSGRTNLGFLDMELNYGVAYGSSTTNDPDSRSWNYNFAKVPSTAVFSTDVRRKDPSEVSKLFNDNADSLQGLQLFSFDKSSGVLYDKNQTAYVNAQIPYRIGRNINGYIKLGGTYRHKQRYQDITSGSATMITNQFGQKILADSLDWIVRSGLQEAITAVGMKDYETKNFMGGEYNYGWNYQFDKMNQITDMWSKVSEYYYSQGSAVWMPIFGEKGKVGYSQNISGSMMDDQNINEDYAAGYLMSELHVGKWLMLLPGIRYENTRDTMLGFKAVQPTLPGPLYESLPGDSTSAGRKDEFWLPMMHMRITPTQYFYAHFAYTNTLSRPDFNSISPNIFINTGFAPFTYNATNPALKAEFWKNYDAQFTLHSNKIGLVSVSGFYKSVRDKIWYRSYKRLKGDPIIDPFPDNALVNVSMPENHQYPIFLKGFEVEVQTGFWYLPKPFKFLTINANYTYTESETQYPLSKVVNIIPPGGGRPVATRVDSTATGPMLFQPKHIVNFSLGFNRKGLNIWLSFQYNGMIFTGKNFQLDEMDPLKEKFYRWDLQIAQKLSKKLTGWEIVANLANLSNFQEVSRLRGDPRPTYMEQFGWTADLGLRYRF